MNDELTRTLPHAVGAEKSVLSTLLQEPEKFDEASFLKPEHFYLPAHSELYEFITKLHDEKKKIELVSFVQWLNDEGILERIGGPGAVTDIYTYAPNATYYKNHLQILCEKKALRMGIELGTNLIRSAYENDLEEALLSIGEPVTRIFDTASQAASEEVPGALVDSFVRDYQNRNHPDAKADGVLIGIPEIDEIFKGLKPKEMGIISARPEAGKSTLATQIAVTLVDPDYPVLFLMLERTTESAFERCVIQRARVPHKIVKEPYSYPGTEDQIEAIMQATRILRENFHLKRPPNRRLSTILAAIRRHVRKHAVKQVFLDQIGLIHGEGKSTNREEELRKISNALQEEAQDLGVNLIVMSQLNEQGETKGAKAIEEDADFHLSIITNNDRDSEEFKEHQHILVAKDSHHGCGGRRLPLILDRELLRFVHGTPEPKAKKNRYS